ncbi:hypothetical protein PS1_014426 [Malus domestica]
MRGRGLLRSVAEESAHHIFDRRTKELLGVIFPPLTEGVGAMGFWGGWSKAEFLAALLEFPHGGSTFLFRGTRFTTTAQDCSRGEKWDGAALKIAELSGKEVRMIHFPT